MLVLERLRDLRGVLAGVQATVGFVPTMGALHAGHASLMKVARQECGFVVVSIFVNPTQFAPGEDLDSYPRTREADIELCREAGVDLVWFPYAQELYPEGAETWVQVEGLGRRFEGESRPSHFRGVATVVTKLFNAVRPDKAYFGQKDLQQLHLIRRMVADLLIPVEVVAVPTAREDSGLARSSRNEYLSTGDREKAAAIYRGLQAVRRAYERGEVTSADLRESFQRELSHWQGAELERFDLYDPLLSRAYGPEEQVGGGYCAVAVRVGKVRLIDNIKLEVRTALCC